MASKTLPDLSELTSIDDNSLFLVDTGIQTFKVKGSTVKSLSGVKTYNAAFAYAINDLAVSGGVIYKSITGPNTGNAVSDTVNWIPLANQSVTFIADSSWVCPAGVSRIRVIAEPLLKKNVLVPYGKGFPIDIDGNMWIWGLNTNGNLGTGDLTTVVVSSPKMVTGGVKFARVFGIGAFYPCGIDQNGNMWTWGSNSLGILGAGISPATTAVSSPVMVIGGVRFQKESQVSGSNHHALDFAGNLWGWGSNNNMLGDNSHLTFSSPILIKAGTQFQDIAGSAGDCVAVLDLAGNIWTWGNNSFGQCGASTFNFTGYSSPVQVTAGATKFKALASCQTFRINAAIDVAGNIWTWGNNAFGQLGINSMAPTAVSSPVMVTAGTAKFKQISNFDVSDSAVTDFKAVFFALDTAGNIWSWGTNRNGILGQNTATGANVDSTVTTSSPAMIAMPAGIKFKELVSSQLSPQFTGTPGQLTMMAMAEDGSIWSWGSNGNGSLGIGISPAIQGSASSPTMVVGGHKFVECSLDGAALGAAAVDNNGHVWVWGLNGLATGVASLSAAVSSPTLIAQLAANFDTNARPHSVKHLTVTPGKTYPISVQAYAAMFGTEAVGQRPGMNKLTIEF